jgi:hypothetical protein
MRSEKAYAVNRLCALKRIRNKQQSAPNQNAPSQGRLLRRESLAPWSSACIQYLPEQNAILRYNALSK